MSEPSNTDRIEWGREVFESYPLADDYEGEPETQLCDLLADLMHFADSEGIDFDAALSSARMHFGHEEHDDGDELTCDKCNDSIHGDSEYRPGKACPSGCGGRLA